MTSELILNSFRNKGYLLGFGLRTLSAIDPLIETYLISLFVKILENNPNFNFIVWLIIAFFINRVVGNFLRGGGKTIMSNFLETVIIELEERLVYFIDPRVKDRKAEIQAIRNLTQSLKRFSEYMKDVGIESIVSLFVIPGILFFVDFNIFLFTAGFLIIHFSITIFVSNKYEQDYEKFDASTENYYGKLQDSNEILKEANIVKKSIHRVQKVAFYMWEILQNTSAIYIALVILVVILEIMQGNRKISHLVLIYGYIKTLNLTIMQVSTLFSSVMEIKAGKIRLFKALTRDKQTKPSTLV